MKKLAKKTAEITAQEITTTRDKLLSQIEKTNKLYEKELETGKLYFSFFKVVNKEYLLKTKLSADESIARLQKFFLNPRVIYEAFRGHWKENEQLAEKLNTSELEKNLENSSSESGFIIAKVTYKGQQLNFMLPQEIMLLGAGRGHYVAMWRGKEDKILLKAFTTTPGEKNILVSQEDISGAMVSQYFRPETFENIDKFLKPESICDFSVDSFIKKNKTAISKILADSTKKPVLDFLKLLDTDVKQIGKRNKEFSIQKEEKKVVSKEMLTRDADDRMALANKMYQYKVKGLIDYDELFK